MSWDEFYSSFKKAAGRAADKINQTADLATLQVKLTMAEHKLDDAYANLGRVAYRHFSEEESSADLVAAAMTAVDEAQKNIDDLKTQIANNKANQSTASNTQKQTETQEDTAKESNTEN